MLEQLSNLELWAILGAVLLIAEIIAVSFFFMFFGIGALATALLTYLGVTPNLTSQLIAFLVLSVGSILLFRKQLKESLFRKGDDYNENLNERAKVSVAIPAKGQGKVFYRGADWIAESMEEMAIPKDAVVIIKKMDGIRIFVSLDT